MGFMMPRKVVTIPSLLVVFIFASMQAEHAYFVSAINRWIRLSETRGTSYLRGVPEDIKNPTLRNESRKRAFVCITGQLSRLELANKEEKLFRYWHDNFDVDFDVALVLSATNHSSVKRGGAIDQQFFSTSEVADYLTTIPGVSVLNSDDFVGSDSPVVNPQYYEQRSATNDNEPEQKLHRTQNHVRQFESMSACYYHMQQSPVSAHKYDIVHRVRDDSGYYMNVPFDKLLKMTQREPKTIVTSSCQQHGGINDRGGFVSPLAAYDYFVHPIIHMYTKPLPTDVRSTELYLMNTYSKTCHLAETHQFRMFRIWNDEDSSAFYPGTNISRFLPGTNFDSERGALERCIIGLDNDEPRRPEPRCHVFSDGNEVCVEIL